MTLSTPGLTHPGKELRDSALRQLDSAARALNLDPGMHKFLSTPERTLIVSVPVTLEEGQLEVYAGYRVQHSTGRGPGKGGIRRSGARQDEGLRLHAARGRVHRRRRACREAIEKRGIFP